MHLQSVRRVSLDNAVRTFLLEKPVPRMGKCHVCWLGSSTPENVGAGAEHASSRGLKEKTWLNGVVGGPDMGRGK